MFYVYTNNNINNILNTALYTIVTKKLQKLRSYEQYVKANFIAVHSV